MTNEETMNWILGHWHMEAEEGSVASNEVKQANAYLQEIKAAAIRNYGDGLRDATAILKSAGYCEAANCITGVAEETEQCSLEEVAKLEADADKWRQMNAPMSDGWSALGQLILALRNSIPDTRYVPALELATKLAVKRKG